MNKEQTGITRLDGFSGQSVVINHDTGEVEFIRNGIRTCNFTGQIGRLHIKLIREYWHKQRDYEERNSCKKNTDAWTVEACHRQSLDREIA